MVRRSFSLNNLREGINKRYEELAHPGSDQADVKSLDDISRDERFQPFTYQQEDFDRTEAPKDNMRKYWRQYETTPIVRKPISSFASQVMEKGYYIESDQLTDDEKQEIRHWLERSAIIEGMPGKDFRLLAKKAVVQREVRGTALIEKAPDSNDEDKVAGLKLINPETMEAVTRPGQSILLAPDDTQFIDTDGDDENDGEDLPMTPDGEAAAYLQDISDTDALWGSPVRGHRVSNTADNWKIAFTRDDVIKLTRDADVGEIFGTSRIEAVSDRIEGLKHKLSDNDEAIASKAYPLWLFYFGTEEEPWGSDDINDFMSAQEMENFHPGMKQGVRGDLDVDTVSGEVAEIADYLDFDIDWILSAMPMPKFALGAFSETGVGQIGGIAQQRDVQRQILEARRELGNEFTPMIREVAEQQGFDPDRVDDLKLKIGAPGEPETPIGANEQVIRYINQSGSGGGNGGGQQGQQNQQNVRNVGPEGQPLPGDDSDSEPLGIDEDDTTPGVSYETGEPEENAPYGAHVWNESNSIAQLSLDDQRKRQVADAIYATLKDARDSALGDVSDKYGDNSMHAARYFENAANTATDRAVQKSSLTGKVRPAMKAEILEVNDEFGSSSKFTAQLNVNHFSQNVENAVRDAMDELMRKMRIQLRRGAEDEAQFNDIQQRVEKKYDDAALRQRAELIAHMEMKNAVETTKLQKWENDASVIGVRLSNENPSTPLTQSLQGAEAYFDESKGIDEQLMEQTRGEFLHQGFNPLPTNPPFHFNDKSTLEPIME